ncbi:MAG TPA: pilus assembly protein PilM [Sedimentisphaerales bacterium]|nr:pilus assembly protein PilM [Sedimentisphaerales bacterium]
MVGTRHLLGLAIDDCGVVATELCVRAGRPEIRGAGELSWDREFSPENVVELGQQLRRFLREQGFTAKKAVVGLAAKWVLAKEVETPPATPEALAGMLNIQAERAFSLNSEELVFDYCGKTSASQKSQVLLLAARRQIVERVKELAAAAGVQVQSITVSAFACGGRPSQNGSVFRYGLYTRPTYCELWGQANGSPQFIKHIPLVVDGNPSGYADLLTTTIQRQILLSSRQDQAPPQHVSAFDAFGLSGEVLKQINDRLGPHQISVRDARSGLLPAGVTIPEGLEPNHVVAAVAVALTAVGPERPAVDFLHPRIGEKKKASHKRFLVWAAGIGVVCLIGLGLWLLGWQGDRRDIAAYKQQLTDMDKDLTDAKDVVARLTYASSWGATDPRFLSCLREVTQAFPEEGVVWATSLALNESGVGSVVGKLTNESSFYEVFDKIDRNPAFANTKLIHIRDVGQNSREKEFAISFTFKGAK